MQLSACSPAERARWLAQAEAIFFGTAYTMSFSSPAAKLAFFNRWFGCYAETQPQTFLLSIGQDGDVTGYLAGSIDSYSAASKRIRAGIDYFTPAFCEALKDYPSHFHINVDPANQGQGIGHRLTVRFLDICAEAGSPGIHVVTGASSRAIKFYEACGFRRLTLQPEADAGHAVLVYATAAP